MMEARCERLEQLFDQALDMSPEKQQLFIEEACKHDEEMACELRSLLVAEEALGSFLEQPLIDPWLAGPVDEVTLPPDIGPYQLHHCLGEGGMGSVWLARQLEPINRMVAIKVLKGQGGRSHTRFMAEYQALARLNHPHIAQILEAGADRDGRAFFSMEYLPGLSITKYAETHGLTVRQRVELVVQLCSGLEHAHQRGIIHRDIKPSNVLVTDESGSPQVKVIDFGIAKSISHRPLTPETLETQHGVLLGTPTHMSPEQTKGPEGEVDTRTDIYSVGAVLYELLAGEPVFSNERFSRMSYDRMIMVIRNEFPLPPSQAVTKRLRARLPSAAQSSLYDRQWAHDLSGELDGIVAQALAKEPDRRYPTMSAFADDLIRYLEGRPVLAMPDRWTYRFWKLCQRHALVTWLLIALFVTLIAGLAVSLSTLYKLNKALYEVQTAKTLADREVHIQRAISRIIRDFIQAANPVSGNPELTVGEALIWIEKQVRQEEFDNPIVAADVSVWLADSFWRLGENELAKQAYDRADRLYCDYFGDLNSDSLRIRVLKAEILYREGNRDQARESLSLNPEELALLRSAQPIDYRRFQLITIQLGNEFLKPADREAKYRQFIQRLEPDEGNRNLLVSAYQDLATTLRDQNKFEEALRVLNTLLASQHALTGPSGEQERQDTQGLIAKIHFRNRNYEASVDTYALNVLIQEARFSEDHVTLNKTRFSLAMSLWRMDELGLAEDYFLDGLAADWASHPKQLEEMKFAKSLSSFFSSALGDHSYALAQFHTLLGLWEEERGTKDKDYLSIHYNLSYALLVAGRYQEAADQFQFNLCLWQELFTQEASKQGLARLGLGQALWLMGDHEKAATHFQHLWEEIQGGLWERSTNKHLVQGYYGHCRALTGDTEGGLPLLRDGYEQSFMSNDPDPQWLIPALEYWHDCL